MNSTTTVRTYIQEFLTNNQVSMNQFAELTGMNVGTISNIINGKRPIAVQYLDQIIKVIQCDAGYIYDIYVKECFEQESPDWRRLGPLLRRCAELDKLNYVEKIVKNMLDNLNYIPLLFDMAEELRLEDKKEAAIIIYECISESERAQHSERLALCQYRLFMLKLTEDQVNNLIVVTSFEPYVERLEEEYQLDAINEVINIHLSLRRWKRAGHHAATLLDKATKYYKMFGRSTQKRTTIKPLLFYILYAYLIQGDVYYQLGDYEKALKYVDMYENIDWVVHPLAEEEVVITQFSEWAEANRYLYQLMAGRVEILNDYVEYIGAREYEIFVGLYYIITAANKYDFNIDSILERFKDYLSLKKQKNRFEGINNYLTLDRYTDFSRELALYYFKKDKLIKGIHFLLESLASAIKINNENTIVKAMCLFEQYRTNASLQAEHRYKSLVMEVLKINEIKVG
ncbi:transcriptional regulator with XRE-family HTH domain [Paenibacillus turicensis]|uniref:Transcriptional regulator with XRE-family HTH domain n=1 Tax=Paenibacillus turicensis TaxID=160487 RepID=A0ABS4FTG7_9BACL|nr:helix-turn-helix transcriptional regulator [Paenibacillus turicensis]MBP1905870.1 transcriptional regulator with XRE-family HTH domain [Paenibacillus turicensis]